MEKFKIINYIYDDNNKTNLQILEGSNTNTNTNTNTNSNNTNTNANTNIDNRMFGLEY